MSKMTMSAVTVAEYANTLKIPPELLVSQLRGAGIACPEGINHLLSPDEKHRLLDNLKMSHGVSDKSEPHVDGFTRTREKVTELNVKVAGSAGKKTVKVVTKQS